MDTQKSAFNRILLAVLIMLYAITIVWFSYQNWTSAPAGYYKWWMVLGNILILSIPTVALYGGLYILAVAWREHHAGGVNPRLAQVLHWAPRIASIIIILFLSLFSFDVFEAEAPPLELIGGFLMHNIPSITLLALLLFAWKRPVVGFVGFLAAAVLGTVFFLREPFMLANLIMLVLPILLIACLFYADWKVNQRQKP
jgi:hypothetical protein